MLCFEGFDLYEEMLLNIVYKNFDLSVDVCRGVLVYY